MILCAGNDVVKLDAATGNALWTYAGAGLRKGGKPRFYFDPLYVATPVLSGGLVYVCTTEGHLMTLSEATGERVCDMDMKAPITSSPAVSGNAVFLCTHNGTVFALAAPKHPVSP